MSIEFLASICMPVMMESASLKSNEDSDSKNYSTEQSAPQLAIGILIFQKLFPEKHYLVVKDQLSVLFDLLHPYRCIIGNYYRIGTTLSVRKMSHGLKIALSV